MLEMNSLPVRVMLRADGVPARDAGDFVCTGILSAALQQYSLTNVRTEQVQHIYRDGNRARGDPHAHDHRHPGEKSLSWDLLNPSVPCNAPSTGDWVQTLQSAPGKPVMAGEDTLNVMHATVYAINSPGAEGKLWRENSYGLLVKFVMARKGAAPREIFEVKNFKVGKPDPSVFAVPARCMWGK